MRFHVARDGAIIGEFDERLFRSKVFAGEIPPTDLDWTAGFSDWRPVSEFRVARKTERLNIDVAHTEPPQLARHGANLRVAGIIAAVVVLGLIAVVFTTLGH